jgi:hypothetical protein
VHVPAKEKSRFSSSRSFFFLFKLFSVLSRKSLISAFKSHPKCQNQVDRTSKNGKLEEKEEVITYEELVFSAFCVGEEGLID